MTRFLVPAASVRGTDPGGLRDGRGPDPGAPVADGVPAAGRSVFGRHVDAMTPVDGCGVVAEPALARRAAGVAGEVIERAGAPGGQPDRAGRAARLVKGYVGRAGVAVGVGYREGQVAAAGRAHRDDGI